MIKNTNYPTVKLAGFFLFLLIWVSSCSSFIEFPTQRSAEPRYSGIQKVGINNVLLMEKKSEFLNDNLGSWNTSTGSINDSNLTTLVRKSLIANLDRYSDYQVYDLQDIRKLNKTFQLLRPMSGERISNLDLIINIQIAYQTTQQSGVSQQVMTFRRKKTIKQGNKWIKTQDSSQERVVNVPYSNSKADFIAYVEVIRTKNGDSKVLKSFNTALTHQTEPMTTAESLMNELAVVITSSILKNVSRYTVYTKREIDKGSDGEIVKLLEEAQLEKASRELELSLSNQKERNPADLYNLGICYEAMGDPALALQMYRDAHKQDKNKELYMIAIGEIE